MLSHAAMTDAIHPVSFMASGGNPDHMITDPSYWSSHVEKVHGIEHAPNLQTDPGFTEVEVALPFLWVVPSETRLRRPFQKPCPRWGSQRRLYTCFPLSMLQP
jgi:hypothetical protein